jgi:hypothetical protein
MTTATATLAAPVTRLDFSLLRRATAYFAALNALAAYWVPDPLAYAAGGCVPWLLLKMVGTPTMPVAVAYLFLWQWAQVFARALQAVFDGESMAAGVYGVDVLRAYWYMLASLVTMALAFRLVLGRLRPPTVKEFFGHERWQTIDLTAIYVLAVVAATGMGVLMRLMPALAQPLDIAARIKAVALFLLCTYVFTSGRGGKLLLAVVALEILVGFTGFFSDFRGVFIYVAIAALAARIRWSPVATVVALGWLGILVFLALFWTAVKGEYRTYAANSDESQAITVPLADRMAYLGNRLLALGDIEWSETSYMLLIRFAYVDIFGQVIGVSETSTEPEPLRQWHEAMEHLLQPRFLFPNKLALSDSDVYMRLARADPSDQVRSGTSISVGYMAENFADLGFPAMLGGVFVVALMMACIIRYFMSNTLPWMLREGIVMGFVYTMAKDGVEISLPKLLGAMLMYFIVWALIAKLALPVVIRWLDQRAAARPAHP